MTHVAITGASSGIGEALAREFLKSGAKVSMVARRVDQLERIAKEAGGQSFVMAGDMSKLDTCTQWLAPAQAALGPVDVLINNAGVQIVGPTQLVDVEAGQSLIRVDLMAPLLLQAALLPAMMARKSGCIVNVASLAALAPTPGMAWYNAAKGGLAAMSESLRGELLGTGVHVVTVYPGPIQTPMAEAAMKQLPQNGVAHALPVGLPDELARRIRRAVEDQQARVIYPSAYTLARHTPGITRWVMDKFTPPFDPPKS